MYVNVCKIVGRWMSIVWVCVSELYLFRYTRPSEGKTFLCIYSIYIISVSFAYNMQTATWWSDSTEVQLRGAGQGAGHGAETREWRGGKNQWAGKKECWHGPSSRTFILTFCNLSPPLPTWISLDFAKASKSDRPSIIHHSEAAPPVQLQQFLYLHNSLQSPAHLLSRTPSAKQAVNNIRLC